MQPEGELSLVSLSKQALFPYAQRRGSLLLKSFNISETKAPNLSASWDFIFIGRADSAVDEHPSPGRAQESTVV